MCTNVSWHSEQHHSRLGSPHSNVHVFRTPMNTPHDTPDSASAHPVLTMDEAKRFEAELFVGDENREWPAMCRAGEAIGAAVLHDFREIGKFPDEARVLVLAGKGHNGGDALLAAKAILKKYPRARVHVCFVFGERALRPLAARACRELVHSAPGQIEFPREIAGEFALCIDGVFGFQFRPPVDKRVAGLIKKINALSIRMRAAVDLPSGLGGTPVLRADFTYATGILKTPLIEDGVRSAAGRVRYLDLGFFDCAGSIRHSAYSVLTAAVLKPLGGLRPARTDKRDFGHLFIIGGSKKYPGAIVMSVIAALQSGAGLVTAFVPESLAPACAAQVPEAIWRGMAESPDGGLALEDFSILRERLLEKKMSTGRATALLIGPGLSRDREAHTLVLDVLRMADDIPVVLDADALQPDLVAAGKAPRILTPHAGEFARICETVPPTAVVVRKGPLTHIHRGGEVGKNTAWISPFGGPVLARGGSGDLLAGLIGGLLAQSPGEPLLAACRGTVWHGMAADYLARTHGQRAVRITRLMDFLPEVLRDQLP